MKNKYNLILVSLFILFFSFILDQNINITAKSGQDSKNIIPKTSAGDYWCQTWDGHIKALVLDSSDNIYIAGDTSSYGSGAHDMFLLKYNSTGELLWDITWGGAYNERSKALILDSFENIYLVGDKENISPDNGKIYLMENKNIKGAVSYNYDIVLLKFNSSGDLQWNITWGKSYDENTKGIALDSLNNIYITGDTSSFDLGGYDMFLLKYNSTGELLWDITWGGIESEYEEKKTIALDSSNNIYLAGYVSTISLATNIGLLKFNSSGDPQWNATWGGAYYEHTEAIALDSSNNIYLAGNMYRLDSTDYNMFLLKYNSTGDLLWNITWDRVHYEYINEIALDSSGTIYIAGDMHSFGSSDYNVFLLKLNSAGELLWNLTWGGIDSEYAKAIAFDSLNNIYVAGDTKNYTLGEFDTFIIESNSYGILQRNCTWGGKSEDSCFGIGLDSLDNIYLAGFRYGHLQDTYLVKNPQNFKRKDQSIPGYNNLILLVVVLVLLYYMNYFLRKKVNILS